MAIDHVNLFSAKMNHRLWGAVGALLMLAAGSAAAQSVPDFVPAALYPTAGGSGYVAVGDVNGDGIRDLVTSENAKLGVGVMLGRGNGTFGRAQLQVTGTTSATMTAADFNEDGKADIVTSNGVSVVVLLAGTGGQFQPPVFFSAGITPNLVTVADFNGDGHKDLGVAGANGFSVMLGDGRGGFQLASTMPTTFSAFSMLAGDFNHDGKMDFLGGNLSYLGNGDGTFAAPVTTINAPSGSQLGDFDGDGTLDLLYLTARQQQDGSHQVIAIAVGQPDGTFVTRFEWVMSLQRIGTPVLGDFNADGKLDVATVRGSTLELLLLAGRGDGTLTDMGTLPIATGQGGSSLVAADVDSNRSSDVMLLHATSAEIFRNTHGTPPLLAQVALSPATVVGGRTDVTGTVAMGGPAPAAGVVVTLASSDTAIASILTGSTVTIPGGASSATFTITTSAVAAASTATISATAGSVTQTAKLSVVAPYSLTGLTLNPAAQYGIFTTTATLTLSGPADTAAVVTLGSSNPAVATPPQTVTVPAGSTTVSFPVTLTPVTSDTAVTISASMDGTTLTAGLTVLKPLDTVRVTKAIDVVKQAQLRVEATGSNATATLTVYNAATGALIGTMTNGGSGKYTGTFTVSPAVLNVVVKSSLGGTTTAPVQQK